MTKTLSYFLNVLEKKDYSVKELRLKGQKREYETAEIEETLKLLQSQNLVNDTRLTEFLIEKYTKTRGFYWIQQKLKQRYLPKELIEKHLLEQNLEEIDLSFLKSKLERKYKITDWQNLDIKVKNKVLGYLSRNGFSKIYDILNDWMMIGID